MIDPFRIRRFKTGVKEPIEALYEDLGMLLYLHDKSVHQYHIALNHTVKDINMIIQMKVNEEGEIK